MTEQESHIKRLLASDERLILVTESDIDRDGLFGVRWFAVTNERVMTLSDDGAADGPEVELPLKDLKTVKAVHLVGQVALEAETKSRKVELLRCSNSLSERFSKIAKSLTDACKDGKEPEFDIVEEEQRTCPNCGRLLPEKGSFCPACLRKTQVLSRLWGYMWPHLGKLLIVSLCIVVGTALALVPPYLIMILTDSVFLGDGGPGLLLMLAAGLAAVEVASTLLTILRGRLAARLGARIVHDVRFDFFQAIQGMTLRRYDKTQTGALVSRLAGDTRMLSFFFTRIGAVLIPTLLQVAGICVMLFVLDWRLALLVLIPMPAMVAMVRWLYRRLRGLYHRMFQRRARMSAMATDSISGIRVVKAFSQEPTEVRHFGERSSELYHAMADAETLHATAFPIIAFVTTLGTYLVWYFGGLAVLGERVSLGTLMAFLLYLRMFYVPLQILPMLSDFINRAFTAAQRLFEVADSDQEVYEDPQAQPLRAPKGAIRFENVHFGYLKDRPVLKGMDVEVRAGEMIGLVGRSGVGKTTMTNLICRFYDVDEGAIFLDGVDVRKVRLRDLRRHIGIVPQESFLFNGTIAENIAYASPESTREDIIRVAVAANAHGFIMRMPDGYDTRVGERGARLAGGEKQRIAIARAILHDPKILILDEAVSSVDTETEELIQRALARLVKDRTTIAIAHRLSTLKNAHRLLVIEDGKKAELGTHEELFAQEGTYRRLVEMQSKLSAIKAVDG